MFFLILYCIFNISESSWSKILKRLLYFVPLIRREKDFFSTYILEITEYNQTIYV